MLSSVRSDDQQTAYQVLVASTADSLRNHMGDLWDTGKLTSDDSINLPYAGSPLASGATYFWGVRVWGLEDAPSPWSAAQQFTLSTQPESGNHGGSATR